MWFTTCDGCGRSARAAFGRDVARLIVLSFPIAVKIVFCDALINEV